MANVEASRRAFLSGVAAVSTIGATAAAEATGQLSVLRALIAKHEGLKAVAERATDHVEAAVERLRALGGSADRPNALYVQEGDAELRLIGASAVTKIDGRHCRVYDAGAVRIYRESPPRQRWIEQSRPVTLADGFSEEDVARGLCGVTITSTGPWPEAQARAAEIIAAWDWWQMEGPRRQEESGLAAAQKAEDDVWQACTAVLFEIRDVPATTLADMALKARFIVDEFGGLDDLLLLIDEPSDWQADIGLSIVRDLYKLGNQSCCA